MTTREIKGSSLYEFLMSDGHRIPKALRDDPGNLRSALDRMIVVLKCTRQNRNGKDVEDVVSVTYDGNACPEVKSAKRIFAIARDSGGEPMTAEDIVDLVQHLNTIDWYSKRKEVENDAHVSKKRQFGQMMFKSYNGEDQAVDELEELDQNDEKIAKSSIKAGKYAKEIGIPCLFKEDGTPVNDLLHTLTRDESAIIKADTDKLRRIIQFVGRILHY